MAETTAAADVRRSTGRACPGGRKAPPGGDTAPGRAPLRSGWQRRAACRKSPTAIFFPTGNSEYTRLEEEPAKAICSACPVRASCLAFAIEHDEQFGVWAGLNPQERRALVAAREPAGS